MTYLMLLLVHFGFLPMIPKVVRSISSGLDSVLQDDIDHLVEWSETWQAFFNITKCKIMTIGNTYEVRHYTMHTNSLMKQCPQLSITLDLTHT